ncbi:MAG: amphi-Trp domain-containing protein [Myxococcales bacterium]|nr:amphi-Trp domain-containing protein [Myxococcales bacterium]
MVENRSNFHSISNGTIWHKITERPRNPTFCATVGPPCNRRKPWPPARSERSATSKKSYPRRQFIAKLRRLADCLERGERLRIQVAGERVSVPPNALINIEHERGSSEVTVHAGH